MCLTVLEFIQISIETNRQELNLESIEFDTTLSYIAIRLKPFSLVIIFYIDQLYDHQK